jgi:hypothetical protein
MLRALAPLGPQIAFLGELLEPELELGEVHLAVELRAPRKVSDAEGLIGDVVARGQQRGALGEVERVHVPLEGHVAISEVGEEEIVRGIAGRMDRFEADLAFRALADLRIQGPREELAPEADAEEGDPAIERLPDHVGRLLDERLLVGVLDVERGTEDDDAPHVVERRPRLIGLQRVPHPNGRACALHGSGRDSERLRGVASDEEDGSHRARV